MTVAHPLLLLLVSAWMLTTAHADEPAPQVLFDSGRSVPMSAHIAQLVAGDEESNVLEGLTFPFRTSLTTKVLQREGVQVFDAAWMTQPLAIVAADELSMRWLAFNHVQLRKLGAVIVVVQAKDAQAFKLLQQFIKPLGVAPELSPWLASRLQSAGAGVYPLLVHTDGRAYQSMFQFSPGEIQ
ncbi:DUF2859 domain-containing protein [Comamonas sp.]|uniref:DUF2859 domain-containing protein n=1 Tax=Comamonas sp. TaxID=34028 RepID=UPI00258B48F3|nr:DUF2859 domain-containing protein [Comamonas sp.]